MQALGGDEPVVELGFESIEQLPGEAAVRAGISEVIDTEMKPLLGRENLEILPRISL